MLKHEKIKYIDYREYSKRELDWLISHCYISLDEDGYIKIVNEIQILILKDLYENEVINFWHCPKPYHKEIFKLVQSGMLEFEDSLFSKPEQDYFNYHLNNSTFNNSLALRNKYIHANENDDEDEEKHKRNYLIFLKLFILIIIKINDELCIVNDNVDYKKEFNPNK